MVDRQGKFEFNPRVEYIDNRDIRNAFALPRFDDFHKMREHNKPFSSDFPEWSLFRSEPMTHQTFTTEDFESDASSVSSAGSTGSSKGQPLRSRITRGSRVHHIPILVEGRDDSSGYSSDTKSEETKPAMNTNTRAPSVPKTTQGSSQQANRSRQPQPQGSPAQRSQSDQQFAPAPRPDVHPKKSASQPPSSPPPAVNGVQQPGPFVTQVRVNMPVSYEDKQAQLNQQRKPPKPKPDPTQQISDILREMQELKRDVETFAGTTKDKQYRYLDEMLTRLMLKLDDVSTEGQEEIRLHRRQAVKEIQNCITLLEKRISENEKLHEKPKGKPEPEQDPATGTGENKESHL